MKKNLNFRKIVLIALLFFTQQIVAQVSTPPASGDGSEGTPYQIETLDNLYWLSQNYADYTSQYFIQTADIDASSTSTWDSSNGFSPIGNLMTASRFDNYYDGNGKTISNLYINRPAQNGVALFGYTSSDITNLTLTNVNITGNYYVGALIGFQNYGVAKKCNSSGVVNGSNGVGGLIGFANSSIQQSHSSVNISVTQEKGGGLVGYANTGGSLFIKNSFAIGSVIGSLNAASLGGLIGSAEGDILIQNCHSIGEVSAPSGTNLGGLIGSLTGATVTDCFWDNQTSLQISSAGGTGKTTLEMGTIGTFTNWDFEMIWTIIDDYPSFDFRLPSFDGGLGTIQNPYIISSYNHLLQLAQSPELWSAHFAQISDIDASASISTTFSSIGSSTTPFTGTYNGNDYTIDALVSQSLFSTLENATINNLTLSNMSMDGVYLVGGIAGSATNSTITNCTVSGHVGAVLAGGGLVGAISNSTITNCSVDVDVVGDPIYGAELVSHLGGLIGLIMNSGSTITNCFSLGTVSGFSAIGGLIGGVDINSTALGGSNPPSSEIGFTLSNCYAANILTITGVDPSGGLFGQSTYVNTGEVTITNSFWDRAVTGTTEAYIGGIGKTTVEMQTQGTFTGWDFTNTWNIDPLINNGYPFFQETPVIAWTGAVDNDWNTAANWSPAQVPTATDHAQITDVANDVIVNEDPGTPALCKELTVNSNASLTINPTKALTVNGNIINVGTITLNSDATGTATLINTGTISSVGTFNAEQYLTGAGVGTPNGRRWYISSPITNATSASVDAAGTDKLFSYNEATLAYTEITNNVTTLNPTRGYVFRGGTNQTINFTGATLNTGAVSSTGLTYTGAVANTGYNLVGNPYPSFFNWESAILTNVSSTYTIKSVTAGNVPVNDTYNGTSHIGTNNNGTTLTQYIAPNQAFWAEVTAGTGQIDFTNAGRSHQTATLKSTENSLIRLNLTNGFTSDQTIVNFNDEATANFDPFDSKKVFIGTFSEIHTTVDGKKLVINTLPNVSEETVVPLTLTILADGKYNFEAEEIAGNVNNFKVYIEDKLTNTLHNLSETPKYSFNATTGESTGRFSLVFGEKSAASLATTTIQKISLFNVNREVNINMNGLTNGEANVYNVIGKKIATIKLNESTNQFEIDGSAGVYTVIVKAGNFNKMQKIIVQ